MKTARSRFIGDATPFHRLVAGSTPDGDGMVTGVIDADEQISGAISRALDSITWRGHGFEGAWAYRTDLDDAPQRARIVKFTLSRANDGYRRSWYAGAPDGLVELVTRDHFVLLMPAVISSSLEPALTDGLVVKVTYPDPPEAV